MRNFVAPPLVTDLMAEECQIEAFVDERAVGEHESGAAGAAESGSGARGVVHLHKRELRKGKRTVHLRKLADDRTDAVHVCRLVITGALQIKRNRQISRAAHNSKSVQSERQRDRLAHLEGLG